MRWRPFTWLLLSLMFFVAAFYFWRLGDQWAAKKATVTPTQSTNQNENALRRQRLKAAVPLAGEPIRLLTQAGNLNSFSDSPSKTNGDKNSRFKNRLTNTTKSVGQLTRSDKAILFENALIDTSVPAPTIPSFLSSQGDPGTYIVQSRQALDNAFRALLAQAGASIVAYVPNNAYLVRIGAAGAQNLRSLPQTQAVL